MDAGHGGSDGGTVGGKAVEKDINLSVALKLKAILENDNIEVILTRSSDENMSLAERTSVANDSNADFFISLHCNYYEKDAQIAGLECYYNNSNATESKGYAESIINAVSLSEDIETIRVVVKKRRNSAITCVCFVCMAGISLLKGWIPALICILIALFFLWRAVGKFSDEYLRELYEEGLLVPGMIVKTEPLTIMAIANMVAQEGGKYHSSFQPHMYQYNAYVRPTLGRRKIKDIKYSDVLYFYKVLMEEHNLSYGTVEHLQRELYLFQ